MGGKTVNPGDIIVGDADGVIVIDPAAAKEIAQATRGIEAKETGIMKNNLEHGTYDRPWVLDKLKEIGCEGI
ncbi:MAG: hypothetical protein IKS37_01560 [Solobacterium sp.]|nr:hypothetical protein [Solobacterium sp.]